MIKISTVNIDDTDIERVIGVIKSGHLVHGEMCQKFEAELCRYLSVEHAILVSSGTAALHLSMLALGIGVGDAVLVPNFTFPATIHAVQLVGAEPILVDVDPTKYVITKETVERALRQYQGDNHIRAIMPVHEFGQAVNMEHLADIASRFELLIVEDAACAIGATFKDKPLGTFGEIGCFSFHPRKILTTGEGGLLVTNNSQLATRLKALKDHGLDRSNGAKFTEPGFNYRLTNIQAALGIGQIARIDQWIRKRRVLADEYRTHLASLVEADYISLPSGSSGHSWQTFMIRLNQKVNRDQVITRLKEIGIESNIGAQCLSTLDYVNTDDRNDDLSTSIIIGQSGLALPLCELYSIDTISEVSKKLSEVLYSYPL